MEHANKKAKIFQGIEQFSGHANVSTTSQSSQFNPSQYSSGESSKMTAKGEVDMAIARYFYANGVPFSHLRSPYFLAMVDAISNFGKGYELPSYDSLRTTMLNKEMSSLSLQLDCIRDSWPRTGCTIMSNGWCDNRKQTLSNVLVQSSQGTMFLKVVDASDDNKAPGYIVDVLIESIMTIGVENVVNVVTESTTNCKEAGTILMEKFPTLFWNPCAAHIIDQLLEDINRILWVKTAVDDAKFIAKFITSHRLTLSRYRSFTSNGLCTPVDTHCVTNFFLLQRIVEEKDALRCVVVGKDWTSSSLSKTDMALHVTNIILGSDFWKGAMEVINIFEPLAAMLRLIDNDTPAIGQIFKGMDQVKERIKQTFNAIKSDYDPIWKMVDSWWNMMRTPLYAAACFLEPCSFGCSQMFDSEVIEGMYDCIEKMYPNPLLQRKIREQINTYKEEKGLCGRRSAKEDRGRITSLSWWKLYGHNIRDLQNFAIRIFGQSCTVSACEKNWSTFEFIHSNKKNKLKPKHLESLTFVHSNLCLLSRNLVENTSGSHVDEGEEDEDVDDDV